MLILTVWLMLMATGGLCYPRAPRATGVLFVAAGAFLFVVWTAGLIGSNLLLSAFISAALGFGQLWRFRDAAVRAEHAAELTGRA
jgi:hypothetical protein